MSQSLSASHHVPGVPEHDLGPDWKRQLAERLDAYRAKRPDIASQHPSTSNPAADSRASKIARSVASRYASAPSYSDLLMAAAHAEHAAAEAQAALARRVAEDARIARERIEHEQREARLAAEREEALRELERANAPPGTAVMPHFAERTHEMHVQQATPEPEPSLEELLFSAMIEPRLLLPSKLIEFPRELVSSQRPRLRAPEPPPDPQFPLTETAELRIFEVQPEAVLDVAPDSPESGVSLDAAADPEHGVVEEANPQTDSEATLRTETVPVIGHPQRGRLPGTSFIGPAHRAVAPQETISAASIPAARDLASPVSSYKGLEWAAISLDVETEIARPRRREETSAADPAPLLADAASIDRRLMAFAVDFAAVSAGFLAFLLVFAAATPVLPTGLTAVAAGGVAYGLLWAVYQMLFFSLSGASAGMLYARIALCTFDDQNPTRSAMRRRLAAWWLSCLPLGLGFLWCFVDEDNLSWHDRITRIYQRSY